MQAKESKEFAAAPPKKEIVTVSTETSVPDALELMRTFNIHHLVVVRNGECIGLVTSKELLKEVEGATWYGSARTVTVGEVMRFDVPELDENSNVRTALKCMLDNGLTALPLTRKGKVVGIITETDLLRLMERLLDDHHSKLREIVNRGEVALAHPLVQNVMKALSEAGV